MLLESAEGSRGTTVEHLPGRNDPRVHMHSALENTGVEMGQPDSCWVLTAIPAGGCMYGECERWQGTEGRGQGGLGPHNFLIWVGDVGISFSKDQH